MHEQMYVVATIFSKGVVFSYTVTPRHCTCCGIPERQGCVRGFACRCSATAHCIVCHRCLTHCRCKMALEMSAEIAEPGKEEQQGHQYKEREDEPPPELRLPEVQCRQVP